MANSGGTITRSELITDDALKWGDEYVKELNQAIAKNKEFVDSVKEINKLASSIKMVESSKEYKKAKEQEIILLQQANVVWKEQTQLENALISTLRRRELATEATNRKLIEERMALQQTNKEIRQEILERTGQVNSYQKLNNALNNVRNQAKIVKADMFNLEQQGKANTQEYEQLRLKSVALTAQTNVLDKGIKDIDKSLGLHQREVGNYGIAVENLNPIFNRVNSQLGTMGLSLNQLAGAKNPFGELITGVTNFGKATLSFMISPVGIALTVLGGLFALIRANKDTVIEFNSGLLDVGKTTGIADEALTSLGSDLIQLSRDLQTVGTPALMEYAAVAGQLGVKGSENILKFTKALAMLETASTIQGEEGASDIARLLTLTDGGVQNVQEFGDEIVKLGNNFAATESEILSNATAIAQSTGIYKLGRQEILAYATATKAVGSEAQVTGSVIGRTLGAMEKSIRTGQNIDTVAKLTGQSVEELKSSFSDNSGQVLTQFVAGLNAVDNAGGSVNAQLEQLGITGQQDLRVLGSLATGGFATLEDAMVKVKEAGGAMTEEFETAQQKLENQFARTGIAWDNFVLSLENGEGIFSKIATFFAGQIADTIEKATVVVEELSLAWSVLMSYFESTEDSTEKSEKGFMSIIKTLLSLDAWIAAVRFGFRTLMKLFLVDIPNAINKSKGGFEILRFSLSEFANFIKEVAPQIKDYILDMLNPFATANAGSLIETFDKFKNNLIKGNKEITTQVLKENEYRLNDFNQRYADAQKKQTEGKLEAERDRLKKELELQDGADKEKRSKYLKYAKELADAEFALNEFRLKNAIENNKAILESDKSSLEERLDAFHEISQLETSLIRDTAEKKLKDISWYNDEVRNLTSAEITDLLNGNDIKKTLRNDELLVIEQYQASILANQRRFNDDRQKLIDEEVDRQKKAFQSTALSINTYENNDTRQLTEQYNEDLKNFKGTQEQKIALTEAYESRLFAIRSAYAKKQLELEIGNLEKILSNEEISQEKRIELENQLSKLKLDLANLDVEVHKASLDKKLEQEKAYKELVQEIQRELAYALVDLTNAIFDNRITKIDDEIAKNEEYYSRQMELAGEDERQKQYLQEESEKKRQELEAKKRKEQTKQAIFNKAVNAVEIGVATALGIMQAYAQLGPIAGSAAAIWVGALGALQLATVLATPIPKYEKGTKNHKGGLAEVAEKRPEVIIEPNKEPYVVSKRGILDLPKGTQVIPSIAEYNRLQRTATMMSLDMEMDKTKNYQVNQTFTDRYGAELLEEMRRNTEAIKKNKGSVVVYPQKIDIPHQVWKSGNVNWS